MRDQENITLIDQYVINYARKLRTDRNITQEDFGNIIGVSRSFIRDAESINSRGKYNLKHINALADYFNISPKEFLPQQAFRVENQEQLKEDSLNENGKSKSKKIEIKSKPK